MNTFRLTVSSPDGNVFSGEIVKLDVRGTEGELAVMAGHVPFVTSVVGGPCVVWVDADTKKTATVNGGLLSVDANEVTFLAGPFRFDEDE
ncbi:MAG: hypothetical protein IKU56_00895 [Clostridia bacterium]|nr:hypothetical protein [Clostridia bacterium]